jgi:arginase family enzyme
VPGLAAFDAPLDSAGIEDAEAQAPAALRAAGALKRWGATDEGAIAARIRDSRRDPATGVVGPGDVRRATKAIGARVRDLLAEGRRPLVLGGDCTLLLGVAGALPEGCGLWFVDGHADFYDGESSPTGEAADMELAILTGHAGSALLGPAGPRLDPAAVVLMGHRPDDLGADVAFENARLDSAIDAVTAPQIRELGPGRVAERALARLRGRPAWLHIDLDVLDPEAVPAVSYPQPRGLDWGELGELLRPLATAPGLVGMSIADFNPRLDPEGVHARRVVDELAAAFEGL